MNIYTKNINFVYLLILLCSFSLLNSINNRTLPTLSINNKLLPKSESLLETLIQMSEKSSSRFSKINELKQSINELTFKMKKFFIITKNEQKLIKKSMSQYNTSMHETLKLSDKINYYQIKNEAKIKLIDNNIISHLKLQLHNQLELLDNLLDDVENHIQLINIKESLLKTKLPIISSSCSLHTNCRSCLANKKCGWCGMSQTCMEGDEKGPKEGSCSFYDYNKCSGPKECDSYKSCGDCLKDVRCGWCNKSGNPSCMKKDAVEKGTCRDDEFIQQFKSLNICPHIILNTEKEKILKKLGDFSFKISNLMKLESKNITIDPVEIKKINRKIELLEEAKARDEAMKDYYIKILNRTNFQIDLLSEDQRNFDYYGLDKKALHSIIYNMLFKIYNLMKSFYNINSNKKRSIVITEKPLNITEKKLVLSPMNYSNVNISFDKNRNFSLNNKNRELNATFNNFSHNNNSHVLSNSVNLTRNNKTGIKITKRKHYKENNPPLKPKFKINNATRNYSNNLSNHSTNSSNLTNKLSTQSTFNKTIKINSNHSNTNLNLSLNISLSNKTFLGFISLINATNYTDFKNRNNTINMSNKTSNHSVELFGKTELIVNHSEKINNTILESNYNRSKYVLGFNISNVSMTNNLNINNISKPNENKKNFVKQNKNLTNLVINNNTQSMNITNNSVKTNISVSNNILKNMKNITINITKKTIYNSSEKLSKFRTIFNHTNKTINFTLKNNNTNQSEIQKNISEIFRLMKDYETLSKSLINTTDPLVVYKKVKAFQNKKDIICKKNNSKSVINKESYNQSTLLSNKSQNVITMKQNKTLFNKTNGQSLNSSSNIKNLTDFKLNLNSSNLTGNNKIKKGLKVKVINITISTKPSQKNNSIDKNISLDKKKDESNNKGRKISKLKEKKGSIIVKNNTFKSNKKIKKSEEDVITRFNVEYDMFKNKNGIEKMLKEEDNNDVYNDFKIAELAEIEKEPNQGRSFLKKENN